MDRSSTLLISTKMRQLGTVQNCLKMIANNIKCGCNLVVECHASDLIARVRFPVPAPLSKIVAPDESIEKSTVKVDFFVAFILKKEGWCDMISIVKKKNKIKRELLSKIEWACSLNAIKLEHKMIFEGCLRIIEHTNLAYVEPHRVIIKDKLFLFFNECDYFYVGDLRYKYHLSQLKDYIERLL